MERRSCTLTLFVQCVARIHAHAHTYKHTRVQAQAHTQTHTHTKGSACVHTNHKIEMHNVHAHTLTHTHKHTHTHVQNAHTHTHTHEINGRWWRFGYSLCRQITCILNWMVWWIDLHHEIIETFTDLFCYNITRGESRVAGESRKSCALGCGRALLWNALPVARAALGARWKDPTPELVKSFVNSVKVLKSDIFLNQQAPRNTLFPFHLAWYILIFKDII